MATWLVLTTCPFTCWTLEWRVLWTVSVTVFSHKLQKQEHSSINATKEYEFLWFRTKHNLFFSCFQSRFTYVTSQLTGYWSTAGKSSLKLDINLTLYPFSISEKELFTSSVWPASDHNPNNATRCCELTLTHRIVETGCTDVKTNLGLCASTHYIRRSKHGDEEMDWIRKRKKINEGKAFRGQRLSLTDVDRLILHKYKC